MSKSPGADLDERVRTFAESVRNGMHGFKPGDSWWLLRRTKMSQKNYDKAVTLCDQLGISDEDMGIHLNNTRWVGLIGDSVYTNYLRRGKIQDYYFVTVTMENSNNNSSPIDSISKVVTDDADSRRTRLSYNCKRPWEQLRNEICGNEIASLSSPVRFVQVSPQSVKSSLRLSPQTPPTLLYNNNNNINNKRRREVSPMEDIVHPRQKRNPTTLSYEHHLIKNPNHVMGGKKGWENKSKKRIKAAVREATKPLLKENKTLRAALKRCKQKISESEEMIKSLVDKINNNRNENGDILESSIEDAEELEAKLVKKLGQLLANHRSKTEKAEKCIQSILNNLNVTMPKKILREEVRQIFLPHKLAKAMDVNYTGLNFQALDAVRKVETLQKYSKGMLPSNTTVQNTCRALEKHLAAKWRLRPECSNTSFEMVSFNPEVLLRLLVTKFGLADIAEESGGVEMAITCDGAQFTKEVGHVTIGWKVVDSRAKNPTDNSFDLFLNGLGYQSVNLCYPIRTAVAKEDHTFIKTHFEDVYSFAKKISIEGLPQNEYGPAMKPFKVSAPHDGKGVFEVLGRGGAAKNCEYFCPYCSMTSGQLCSPTREVSLKCPACAAEGKECRHWTVEDQSTVDKAKAELLKLQVYHYCLQDNFAKEEKKSLLIQNVPNAIQSGTHIDYNYNGCIELRDPQFQLFIEIVCLQVENRKQHGLFSDLDRAPSYADRITTNLDELKTFLNSFVPVLKDTLLKESAVKRWAAIINRDEETKQEASLLVEMMVIDPMHLVMRVVEKIVYMILSRGMAASKNKKKFPKLVEDIVNSSQFRQNATGASRQKGNWSFPQAESSTQLIGKVNFCYRKAKHFISNVDKLYNLCLDKDPKKEEFKKGIDLFKIIITTLERKSDFTDEDIQTFQKVIDEFGELWIEAAGMEGMTNYVHYLVSGHVCYYLFKYRNLYKYCQQGWEQLNNRLKQFYFRRTQRGGNKSGGHYFLHIYRFLARRMAWHLGIGDEFFKKKAINDNCPQEMYDSLAIIAGGAGGANM